MKTIRKYGEAPYTIGVLHGGPGAAGEMRPVAVELSKDFGVLEFLQTKESVYGQIEELHQQIFTVTDEPIVLIGFSWGAWLGGLFAARYPERVKKLILVSSGALDEKYNKNLMGTRLGRLDAEERDDISNLLSQLNAGELSTEDFKRFGELMTKADSYSLAKDLAAKPIVVNKMIYEKVWSEAAILRKTGELIDSFALIQCPVVAFHGNYDSHPIEGVEKPLSHVLSNFKIVQLAQCGHTPWIEQFAKADFYMYLKDELK